MYASRREDRPVSKDCIARPGRHDTREQAHSEREAVEKHMDRCSRIGRQYYRNATFGTQIRLTIGNQPETIGPDAISHLHKHEREVQAQEEVNPPRLRRRQDDLDRRARVPVKALALREEAGVLGAGAGRDAARGDDGRARVRRDDVADDCASGSRAESVLIPRAVR